MLTIRRLPKSTDPKPKGTPPRPNQNLALIVILILVGVGFIVLGMVLWAKRSTPPAVASLPTPSSTSTIPSTPDIHLTLLPTSYVRPTLPPTFTPTISPTPPPTATPWSTSTQTMPTQTNASLDNAVSGEGSNSSISISNIPSGTILYGLGDYLADNLHIITLNAQSMDQFTIDNIISPQWSPDGEHLSFVQNDQGELHLWSTNADGTGRLQLSPIALWPGRYKWLGTDHLIYINMPSSQQGDETRRPYLWVTKADGSETRRLSDQPMDMESFLYWGSADGRFVLFQNPQLPATFLIDRNQNATTSLFSESASYLTNVIWLPDEQSFLISTYQEGVFLGKLYLVNAMTGKSRLLYEQERRLKVIGWLRNTRQIVLYSHDKYESNSEQTLSLLNLDNVTEQTVIQTVPKGKSIGRMLIREQKLIWTVNACTGLLSTNATVEFYSRNFVGGGARFLGQIRTIPGCNIPALQHFWDVTPDGNYLVYGISLGQYGPNNNTGLYMLDLGSTSIRTLLQNQNVTLVDWQ